MKKNKFCRSIILTIAMTLTCFRISAMLPGMQTFAAASETDLTMVYDESNYEYEFAPGRVIVALTQAFTSSYSLEAESAKNNEVIAGTDHKIAEDIRHIRSIFGGIEINNAQVLVPSRNSGQMSDGTSRNDDIGDVLLVHLNDQQKQTVIDAINILKENPNVIYAEPDYAIYLDETEPDDEYYDNLWGMPQISAPSAWDNFTGSSTVVVGVVDTGIDYTHPDLKENIWKNPGEIASDGIDNDENGYVDDVYGWDFVSEDNNPMDVQSHGTHVAGTIGAVGNNGLGVAGVNWNVELVALKVFNDSGSGYDSDAIKAINYANNMGINILNNSWGSYSYNKTLEDAIKAYGGLFIASAGNSSVNTDINHHYPSGYHCDNIISVAATNSKDILQFNYGAETVDIAAPGVSIYSTIPNGKYASKNGTSMASPHVAGAAALLMGYYPDLTTSELKELILDSVDKIPDLLDKVSTGGRLNISAMFESAAFADGTRLANTTPVQVPGLNEVKAPTASCGGFDPRGIRQMQEKRVPALGSLLAEIKSIAAGWGHSLIFKRDGSVWVWGCNFS